MLFYLKRNGVHTNSSLFKLKRRGNKADFLVYLSIVKKHTIFDK